MEINFLFIRKSTMAIDLFSYRCFLLKHTEPGEYCVAIINGKSAASMVIQTTERNQSWKSVDGNKPKKALYIHWLCVHRDFAGENLPKNMIDFAAKQARRQNIKFLRVDTNAKEVKLREIYEKLGFSLMSIEQEDYRNTAFYQKIV